MEEVNTQMAENILVVDDEREIADLVEVYLQNEGYTVYKFYNAGDALNCLETTPISLAVLDIMLPDMDGFALCSRQEFAAALRKARGICPQHTMDWGQKDGESCEPPYKFRPRVGE